MGKHWRKYLVCHGYLSPNCICLNSVKLCALIHKPAETTYWKNAIFVVEKPMKPSILLIAGSPWTASLLCALHLLPSLDSWFRCSRWFMVANDSQFLRLCRGSWAVLSHYVLTLCPSNHKPQPASSNSKLASQCTWRLLFILDPRRAIK